MYDSNLTENVLESLSIRTLDHEDSPEPELSKEDINEAMKLYDQVSQVFIRNNTELWTSLKVLSAMADAIALFIEESPLREED